VNDVATELKRTELEGSALLLIFLHGLQSGMDAPSLLEALASGTAIPAPPEKKRGRKKKERPEGAEAPVKVPGKRGRRSKVVA
jgi:hypothetical protein